jgi:hypothetical protein
MRRFFVVLAGLAVAAALSASAASAACTTTSFHVTFAEPFGGPHGGGAPAANCPEPYFSCGHGAVNGLQITEAIQHIDVAPEGDGPEDYDLRTLFFSDGSTVTLKEVALFDELTKPGNSGNTPACCGNQSYGNPIVVPLVEEIVGGTGTFEGITGTVSGTLSIAGGVAIVRLSGTVTYGC